MNKAMQINNTVTIDAVRYTVTLTDTRTDEVSVIEVYRPQGETCRALIEREYARYGYTVDSIVADVVPCPINWERVWSYYKEREQNERLELQTAEA